MFFNIIINFLFVDNFSAIFLFNSFSVIYINDCVQLNNNVRKYSVFSFCK